MNKMKKAYTIIELLVAIVIATIAVVVCSAIGVGIWLAVKYL